MQLPLYQKLLLPYTFLQQLSALMYKCCMPSQEAVMTPQSRLSRHFLAAIVCLLIYTLYVIILVMLDITAGGGLLMLIPLIILPTLYRKISRVKPLKKVRADLIAEAEQHARNKKASDVKAADKKKSSSVKQ